MEKTKLDAFVKANSEQIGKFMDAAFYLHDVEVNQKYGDHEPYSVHLGGVYNVARHFIHLVVEKEEHILPVLFGALFHDSMEDARLTYNDVIKYATKLGLKDEQIRIAAEIVYALTNEKGKTRSERANDKYYQGIRNTPYAPFVKMCDRVANMEQSHKRQSSMLAKYQAELPHFIESIIGEGPDKQVPEIMVEHLKSL